MRIFHLPFIISLTLTIPDHNSANKKELNTKQNFQQFNSNSLNKTEKISIKYFSEILDLFSA
jgi:hypothetical protein